MVTPNEGEEEQRLKFESKIADLTSTIEHLTNLVDKMLLERRTGQIDPSIPHDAKCTAEVLEALGSKKRKIYGTSVSSSPAESTALPDDYRTTPAPDMKAEATNVIHPFNNEDDEATLFSQLSIESKESDESGPPSLDPSAFDFSGDSDVLQDIPPIAPFLATAAIGAFFTKISEGAASDNALSHPYISEGKPLPLTSSLDGVSVYA